MSKTRTAWIVYTALRLLFFAVPFAVLYLLGIWPWLSAIFAALIGVSLSVIFLSKPRSTASESIYDWRMRDRTADDIVEDDAVDAEGAASPSSDASEAEGAPGTETDTAPAEAQHPAASAVAPVSGDPERR